MNKLHLPRKLKKAVEDIFAKEHRTFAYQTLVKAKNHKTAKIAYFNFTNAYQSYLKDDSMGNPVA